ncbi:hypothetical protein BJX99DRAFT_234771 [Aspergillus californicus]
MSSMPRPNDFLPDEDLFISPHAVNMNIADVDMQGAAPAYYPSNIPSVAGMQQPNPYYPQQNPNGWSYNTLPTVDPSCISSGSFLTNTLSPQDLAEPPLRRSSNVDNKRGSIDDQKGYRVKYGQVTPPSDTLPASDPVQPQGEKQPLVQHSVEIPEVPTKQRRGTDASRASTQPSGRGSMSLEPSSPGDGKQEKTRARNRLAASKCRQKKKEQNSQLETRFNEEQRKRERLVKEVDSLRTELVSAKSALLAHSDCGHTRIKEYIQDEANRLTIGGEIRNINMRSPPDQLYRRGSAMQHDHFAGAGFGFDA